MLKEVSQLLVLAFDGDSDRLIADDENGEIVDGDKIIYVRKYLSEKRPVGSKHHRDNGYV